MATGGTGAADRDTVLGWMTRTGSNATTAAQHFGLPFERVKKWAQRAGLKSPRQRADAFIKAEAVEAGVPGDGVPEGGAASRAASPPASRARTTPTTPRLSAANLTDEARDKLRAAVLQQLDFLSRADTVDDQKGRADAARALQTLLQTTPDILTFDDRTSGKDATVNNEAEQLADAFGFKLDGAA
jgi:hypothetical protein